MDPNPPLLALAGGAADGNEGLLCGHRVAPGAGLTTVRLKRIYDILRILQIRNKNVTESTLPNAEPEERIAELR
jgi:hypothetical protein